MRWLKWALVALLALALVLIGAGAAYQWIATKRDEASFPMPGERLDIGGRALHLYCSGSGTPTVLLENGLTANYTAWLLVQQSVAELTRVCSYDRAGMGWSDPSPHPTRAKHVVADLRALQEAAGITGPVLLVGWSAGGVFVRVYYHEHPDDVIGMVLVDSSHEQQRHRLPQLDEELQRSMDTQLALCARLAWTGVVRALGVMRTIAEGQDVPATMRPAFVAMANRSEYCPGMLAEIRGFLPDVSQAEPPAPLADLPLVVLSRGRPTSQEELPVPVSAQFLAEQDRAWSVMQEELARLSTRSVHRVVKDSGHGIPFEAPEEVTAAVRGLLSGAH